MFIYVYVCGIWEGWFEIFVLYLEVVCKGWEGMIRMFIDYKGNIYGVCCGLGYFFIVFYYWDDLGWILNDIYGIGIVFLVGIEVYKMN